MQKAATIRNAALVAAAALLVGLVAALFAAGAYGAGPARLVSTARNASLGKTILVDGRGLSLYSLSVERRGRFICTSGTCLSFWTPLTVKKGVKPTGLAGLGTVKRPDGKIQVTYRGAPLYTFYLDRKRGDVGGDGFKDVGVWHPVTFKAAG
jgi:predicted lipoprotein with Yx(FWY)xxD motif